MEAMHPAQDMPVAERMAALFAAIAARHDLAMTPAQTRGGAVCADLPAQPGLRCGLTLFGRPGPAQDDAAGATLKLEFGPFHDHWPWAERADFANVASALIDGRARVRTSWFRARLEGRDPRGRWEAMEQTGFFLPLGRAASKRVFWNG